MTRKLIVHIDKLVAPGMSRGEAARLPDALARALREALANGPALDALATERDRPQLRVTLAPSAQSPAHLGQALARAIVGEGGAQGTATTPNPPTRGRSPR